MVKRIGFALVAAFVLVAAVATHAGAGVAYGIKGGIGLSHVNADLFSTDNRTGFVGGVYVGIDLAPNIGLQPELLYVRKGAKLFSTDVTVGGITFGSVGTNLDVDYVEVPVLLRLNTPSAGPLDLRLLAGPVLSLKANEALSTTGLIGVRLGSNQIKSTDMGLAMGGAIAVRNGNMKLVAEGRYTLGLANVSKLPFGGDVKNGATYATLGLEFPLGGL